MQDLFDAEMVENDVSVFMDQAKALVDMAWERAADGVAGRDGRLGCL